MNNVISINGKRTEREFFSVDRSLNALRAELNHAYIERMMESTSDAYTAAITAIHAGAINLISKEDAPRIVEAIARLNGNDTAAAVA